VDTIWRNENFISYIVYLVRGREAFLFCKVVVIWDAIGYHGLRLRVHSDPPSRTFQQPSGHLIFGAIMDTEDAHPAEPATMRCPKCQQEKDKFDFRRLASLAQTRAWLKKPTASRRIWYVGTVCNLCRPKRSAADIAPSELEKILIRNDTNKDLLRERIDNRRALGTKKRVKGAIKALQQRRFEHFQSHKVTINKLTAAVSTRLSYLKRKGFADANDYALMRYLRYALWLMKTARQTLTREGNAARAAPVEWQAVIKPDDIVTLWGLHSHLSPEHIHRVHALHHTLTTPVTSKKIDDVERRSLPLVGQQEEKPKPPAWLLVGSRSDKENATTEPATSTVDWDDFLK
jgi:hypothetical protein